MQGDVVGEVVVHEGRVAVQRALRIHHGGEFFDLDLQGVQAVAGGVAVFRDDDGDGVADIADLVHGEGPVVRRGEGGEDGDQGEVAQVFAGENRDDARDGEGGVRPDGANAAVGHVAALEGQVEHAGEFEVIDKDAAAAEEALVFLARHGAADEGRGGISRHCGSSPRKISERSDE